MRWIVVGLLVLVAMALPPRTAGAHSSSSAYLRIAADDAVLHVQWSIALRDLDYAVGLDTDGTGSITWGKLRAQTAAVEAYALARLALRADDAACPPGPVTLLADQLGDGGYAVLRFDATCPAAPRTLRVQYRLLFDLDLQHRGLLSLSVGGETHALVLSPAQPDASVEAGGSVPLAYLVTVITFFIAGIDHLLTGPDHMLFVAMLLLPMVFRRRGSTLQPVAGFGTAFLEAVKVLSCFALAHGTSLTLSVLHLVSVSQRISGCGIALTILLTAIDNIRPILPDKRWAIAFTFGLVHGLGFANALGPLDLPAGQLAAALLSFNLGLDAAQISIAALLLPIGFAMQGGVYRRLVMPGLSGAAAMLALAWFADRASDLGVLPF